jgi:hypothetical protein
MSAFDGNQNMLQIYLVRIDVWPRYGLTVMSVGLFYETMCASRWVGSRIYMHVL